MSQNNNVRLLLEGSADRTFIDIFFRQQVESGSIQIEQCWDISAILGTMQLALLERPEQPIALVANTNTEDPVEIEEEYRGPVLRILASTAPRELWHAAFAIPRLDAWAMADPRIREAFEADEMGGGPRSYYERSVRFAELTRDVPFDRALLFRENAEFRGLADFIERHLAAARATVGAGTP